MNIEQIQNPPKIIRDIPIEYKNDFRTLTGARRSLRDVCSYPGIEITSSIPLNYLKRCMKSIYHNPFNIISGNIKSMPCNHTKELYGAFDLGKKNDPLAFCFCHVEKYFTSHNELQPFVVIDVIGRLDPKQIKDLKLAKVKEIVEDIWKIGHDIRLITFDQWQSYRVMEEIEEDFPQIITAECSMDAPSHYIKVDLDKPNRYTKISTSKNYLAPYEIVSTALEQDGIGCPEFPFLIKDAECLQISSDGKKVVKVAQSDGYNFDDTIQVFISSIWHCILNNEPDETDVQRKEQQKIKKRSKSDSFSDLLDTIQIGNVPRNIQSIDKNFDNDDVNEEELNDDPFCDDVGNDYYW